MITYLCNKLFFVDARVGRAWLNQQSENVGIGSMMREFLLHIARLAASFLPMSRAIFLLILVYFLALLLLTCNFTSD